MFRHQRFCGRCPRCVVHSVAGEVYSYWGRLGSDVVWSGRCIHSEGTCCHCLQGYWIIPKFDPCTAVRRITAGLYSTVDSPRLLCGCGSTCISICNSPGTRKEMCSFRSKNYTGRYIRKLFHTFRSKSCAVLNVTSCRIAKALPASTLCVVLTAVLFSADNRVCNMTALMFLYTWPTFVSRQYYHNSGVVFIYTIHILLITDSNHHNNGVVFIYTPHFVDNGQ